MSIRDPRRDGSHRDPTQSVSLEIDPPSHPSLAIGTHGTHGDERTKADSPIARTRTPAPREPDPPTPDDDTPAAGSVLGSYRLVQLLGKGGMGFVWRAEHVKLGREVALKLLRADYARRRDAVERFRQEARTVNRVRHRNIVDVSDIVDLDDGTTFIIMELLAGTSLGKWARSGVDLPRALAVLVQICDGLGAAHAVGVVHRDLKPDNIVVVPTSDGAELVKLLDFGVAKLVNRDDEDLGFVTAAGSVIGTPAYMSPEQAGGMLVDHRSDIYSLGAMMYELFCGQPMFKGRSFGEYVRKHLTEQPVPPRQTQGGAGIDERLEQLILKCLAKDPNDRFGHILELRDGLMHLLGGVETYPPIYASQSALRTPPTQLPSLPPLAQMPTQPTPVSQSQLSAAYGGYDGAPGHAPVAPWWAWVVGGSLAVAHGIAAAVWDASHDDAPAQEPAAPVATQPTATPIAPAAPAAPATPAFVELRFDSLPSGGVYVAGHSAELCRTPCTYNVDLRDGEPTDRRVFVIRAEGYRDHEIVVDPRSDKRDYAATLDRIAVAAPSPAVEPPPVAPPPPTKTGKPARADKRKKPGAKPDPQPEPEPDRVEAKPPEPTEPKPVDKKPSRIDPVDTLDPFHRHDK